MNRQFVVVGLGRLGISMLATLDSLEHEVLGIDKRRDVIQAVAADLPNVNLVVADATDEDAMRGLNVDDFDAAVMIGEDHMEAGIHARVLERVDADRVIQPELEIGEQLARTMASTALLDYVEFGLTVVALKPRGGPGVLPRGDTVLHGGDALVVGGSKKALDRSPLVRPSDR